jgi:hypothetical protein
MPHESGATFAVVPLIFLFASLSFRDHFVVTEM